MCPSGRPDFSFGAVLYELLSGRRAFSGNSIAQILAAVLHEDPPPLQTASELEKIVMRCLRKRPSERFQSMSEVRAALERILTKPASSEPSIAVLPFVNLSADKENEYFSAGLAEEIINALTRIPGLKVTARTSAFAFRGKEQDVRRIAEALDVQTILEGSVRRAGNRIRVSAQLINAADGYHALYYLLPTGRYEEAAAECARALEEDPLNIMGRLRFAQCLRAAGRIDDGYRELRHALELDDRLWFTHFLLGLEHLLDDQQVKALVHAERAYALAPWNPSARGLLASALRIAGDLRRSEELLKLLKADPAGPAALGLATFHLACSEIDTSADWTERAIAERHPAIFYFVHAHALTLRRSSRWHRLATLLNLPDL